MVMNQKAKVFRTTLTKDTSATYTTTSYTLKNIVFNAQSEINDVTTGGSKKTHSGKLFFNIGISKATPSIVFEVGDCITTDMTAQTLPADHYTVKTVIEHYFKGELHHYELELV